LRHLIRGQGAGSGGKKEVAGHDTGSRVVQHEAQYMGGSGSLDEPVKPNSTLKMS
jgi:hypothetical protein